MNFAVIIVSLIGYGSTLFFLFGVIGTPFLDELTIEKKCVNITISLILSVLCAIITRLIIFYLP